MTRGSPAPLELIEQVETLVNRLGSSAAAKKLDVSTTLIRSVLSGLPVLESTCALLRERLAKVEK